MTYATLAQYLNSQFSLAQNVDFCFRMLFAALCGAVIGAERSRRFKEAGVRTHIIVCVAAALMMIVSKYGFVDLLKDGVEYAGTKGADPARIAAQVVSGISFLCAGVIFKNAGTVKGLTTAAGVWITSGIGLAVGAGMLVPAVFTTVLVCLLQYLMHRYAIGADAYSAARLQFTVKNGFDFNSALEQQLETWSAQIIDSMITRRPDTTEYDLTVRIRDEITYAAFKAFTATREDILSASNSQIR